MFSAALKCLVKKMVQKLLKEKNNQIKTTRQAIMRVSYLTDISKSAITKWMNMPSPSSKGRGWIKR